MVMGVALLMPSSWAQAQATPDKETVTTLAPALEAAITAGDLEEARVLNGKVIQLAPKDPEHRVTLAIIEAMADRKLESLAALRQAVKLGLADLERIFESQALAEIRKDPAFSDVAYEVAQNAIVSLEKRFPPKAPGAQGNSAAPTPPPVSPLPSAPTPPPVPPLPSAPTPPPVPPLPSAPTPPPVPPLPSAPAPPPVPPLPSAPAPPPVPQAGTFPSTTPIPVAPLAASAPEIPSSASPQPIPSSPTIPPLRAGKGEPRIPGSGASVNPSGGSSPGGTVPDAKASWDQKIQAVVDSLVPEMLRASREGRLDEAKELCWKLIVMQPEVAIHRVRLACVWCLLGKRVEAFDALREATDRGFSDLNMLQSNPDLALLRKEEDFFGNITYRTALNAIQQGGSAPGSPAVPPQEAR